MPFHQAHRRAPARAVLTVFALALLAGCASQPDVRHDQDPAADLRAYKTFAFYDYPAASHASYAELLGQRLRQATREQLERRDYVYDPSNPELRVNLQLRVTDKQEIRSAPGGRGFYGYRAWPNANIETVDVRQGTLAIDLVDAARNALVWHGVAEGRIDSKAMQQPGPAIEAAVGEIFAQFPGANAKPR